MFDLKRAAFLAAFTIASAGFVADASAQRVGSDNYGRSSTPAVSGYNPGYNRLCKYYGKACRKTCDCSVRNGKKICKRQAINSFGQIIYRFCVPPAGRFVRGS